MIRLTKHNYPRVRQSLVTAILLSFMAGPFSTFAQYLEIGAGVGGSVYQGDLTETTVSESFKILNGAIWGTGKLNFNKYLGLRLNLTFTKLEGDDAFSSKKDRNQRNLSFFTNVMDAGLVAEWNILGFDLDNKRFTPYINAGIGVFRFNPKTFYRGVPVELQPLGTEGQNIPLSGKKRYNLTQINFPIGGGLKIALGERTSLALEGQVRFTMTDYIDDVSGNYADYAQLLEASGELSAALGNREGEYLGTPPVNKPGSQRGNPAKNDYYLTGGLTFTYHLVDMELWGGRNSVKCPKF